MTAIATNPFDDSFEESKVATNTFEDNHNASPNPFEAPALEGDDDDDDEEDRVELTGSPEASWQYLGDLPYRRVPIYSNVKWNSSGDDLYHAGLASYPSSALKRHPKLLDRREVRTLLTKTTVTKVSGCPNGGPIAVITLPLIASDSFVAELRILTNAGQALAQWAFPPSTSDYTASDVLSMGFTSRTCLVVVMKDSYCYTYNLRGEDVLQPFFIHQNHVLSVAAIYEGGVAVLAADKSTALCEFFDSHDDPSYVQSCHLTTRRVQDDGKDDAILGMAASSICQHYALLTPLPTAEYASQHFLSYLTIAVLPRTRTASRHPEVFLSTSDCSVLVIPASTTNVHDVDCRARLSSPIVDMRFAPNGRFLACFTQSSMLTVISTNFETKVLDFDTSDGSKTLPLGMVWCGEDSVVLHWRNLGVLMVGPYGDWLRFPYENTEHLYLIPELDCCRVVTDSSVEILQRVPPATAQLLRIGSIEPAAMLLDAADAFEAGSPSSDEAARAIVETGQLGEAIEICTDAAVREFDIATQKRLLGAASFGMHFSYKNNDDEQRLVMGGPASGSDEGSGVLPSVTTGNFVDAARKLRIMNALRNPNVGFVVTSSQFDAVTSTGIVGRLIAMKRPALAASICRYLSLSKSVHLYARASKAAALVETDKIHSDSEIAEAAIAIIDNKSPNEKVGMWSASSSINRGAYATVALAANKAGRPGVANLLLVLESSVADKVPALISTGNFADAIAVATTARDADYIFSTLMEYERTCMSSATAGDASKAQSTFLSTVVSKFTPEAFHTLRRFLETTPDVKSVTNLLLRSQKFAEAGAATAKRAMGEKDFREKQGMLAEASRIFSLGKDTAFDKSCTDEYLELLRDQEVLRTKYGAYEVAPESSSVTATITSVLHFAATNVREQHRLLADADKIGKKFRIPEKRLWHVKVKAFADSEQWSNLRILADSRSKPPIGFKPFARAVIQGKQGNPEIMRYIDRIGVPEERYDLFCEASLWKKALDEAVKLKDARRILNVKTLCNSSEIQLLADQTLGRIAS